MLCITSIDFVSANRYICNSTTSLMPTLHLFTTNLPTQAKYPSHCSLCSLPLYVHLQIHIEEQGIILLRVIFRIKALLNLHGSRWNYLELRRIRNAFTERNVYLITDWTTEKHKRTLWSSAHWRCVIKEEHLSLPRLARLVKIHFSRFEKKQLRWTIYWIFCVGFNLILKWWKSDSRY